MRIKSESSAMRALTLTSNIDEGMLEGVQAFAPAYAPSAEKVIHGLDVCAALGQEAGLSQKDDAVKQLAVHSRLFMATLQLLTNVLFCSAPSAWTLGLKLVGSGIKVLGNSLSNTRPY